MPDDLERQDQQYEAAEAAFLEAVRRRAEFEYLALASAAVATAAQSWNAEAYRRLHEASGDNRQDLDLLTERTEVLAELWADIAGAYGSKRVERST